MSRPNVPMDEDAAAWAYDLALVFIENFPDTSIADLSITLMAAIIEAGADVEADEGKLKYPTSSVPLAFKSVDMEAATVAREECDCGSCRMLKVVEGVESEPDPMSAMDQYHANLDALLDDEDDEDEDDDEYDDDDDDDEYDDEYDDGDGDMGHGFEREVHDDTPPKPLDLDALTEYQNTVAALVIGQGLAIGKGGF